MSGKKEKETESRYIGNENDSVITPPGQPLPPLPKAYEPTDEEDDVDEDDLNEDEE